MGKSCLNWEINEDGWQYQESVSMVFSMDRENKVLILILKTNKYKKEKWKWSFIYIYIYMR